ncbi:MAG TPA: DUF2254 domain-containing protein [Actinomycetota bacterium]|nr:DUF2254 domain-containing protein [Actinomycetota bacterium]
MPAWRREALRTTLWVVPSVMTAAAVVLFLVTYRIDLAVAGGRIALPSWAITGQADATRAVLIGIAAAVITVVGVVFSITIIALQLASQQFGPRMLRNFIRDLGTQVSLGAFVATFVYSILTLGSVAHGSSGDFVPHISVTIALVLTLGDLGVLIFFIHHVATSIQVTTVVAGIARDFRSTLAQVLEEAGRTPPPADEEAERQELMLRLESGGELVPARTSGFLQSVGHEELVRIATTSDAVIRLLHRAGHFVVEGQALALVWPSSAVEGVTTALDRAHIVGSNRTLNQDPGFAVDQLVEVAIRALSPAVNDTFTAMNCIDWLGDCLCRAARRPLPSGLYRDDDGVVRLIDPTITFKRLVQKASDKIRQAGRGMPAVLIRQLENLEKVTVALADPAHRAVIDHEAGMILRSSEEAIPEASDREDVLAAYRSLHAALGAGSAPAR